MYNFVFKVHGICSAGDESSLFRGKHYSGTIEQGERIRFAGLAGGFDSVFEGVAETSIGSFNPNPMSDCIIINYPYFGEPYDVKGEHIWIIDAGNNPSMVVSEAFNIPGRGIVVTGVIASGTIKVGDEMAIVTPNGNMKSVYITGIEYFRKFMDVANEGDTVGITKKRSRVFCSFFCVRKLDDGGILGTDPAKSCGLRTLQSNKIG